MSRNHGRDVKGEGITVLPKNQDRLVYRSYSARKDFVQKVVDTFSSPGNVHVNIDVDIARHPESGIDNCWREVGRYLYKAMERYDESERGRRHTERTAARVVKSS